MVALSVSIKNIRHIKLTWGCNATNDNPVMELSNVHDSLKENEIILAWNDERKLVTIGYEAGDGWGFPMAKEECWVCELEFVFTDE